MKKVLLTLLVIGAVIIPFTNCRKRAKDYHIWLYLDGLPYIEVKVENMKADEKVPQGKKVVRNGVRVASILQKFNIRDGKWVEFYGKKRLRLDWSSVEHPLYKVSLVREGDGTYTLAGAFGVLKDTKNWVKAVTGINVISGIEQKMLFGSHDTFKIFFRNKLVGEVDINNQTIEEEPLSSFAKRYGVNEFSTVVVKGPGRELRISKEEVEKYYIKSTRSGEIKVFLKGEEEGGHRGGKRRNMIKNALELHIE